MYVINKYFDYSFLFLTFLLLKFVNTFRNSAISGLVILF